MRNFKLSILAILTLSLLSSCRKGPEDPLLSFTTRKNRISKTWQAYSHLKNGLEQLNTQKSVQIAQGSCGTQVIDSLINENIVFSFSKDGTYSGFYYTTTQVVSRTNVTDSACASLNFDNSNTDTKSYNGMWSFAGGVAGIKNGEQLAIFENGVGYIWDIQRLANSELKIKRKYYIGSNLMTEEIYFKPK